MTDTIIAGGETRTTLVSLVGGDALTVQPSGALSVATGDRALTADMSSGTMSANNSGTIEHTSSGAHAIVIERTGAAESFFSLYNNLGASILSDGSAISYAGNTLSGELFISNAGTIRSLSERAIDLSSTYYEAGGNVSISNSGSIVSGSGDGLVGGEATTIVNSSNGRIEGGAFDAVFSPDAVGVRLVGGVGSLTNSQNALIAGDGNGVRITRPDIPNFSGTYRIDNLQDATILGRSGAGISVGDANRPYVLITNEGLIQGGMTAGQGDGDGISGGNFTLINYGVVRGAGSQAGSDNAGVSSPSRQSSVDNREGGLITGADAGVDGVRSVTNTGLIEATGSAATGISRVASVNNFGTITGTGNGVAIDQAVTEPNSSGVYNAGIIVGSSGYGILGNASRNVIDNSGTITGGSGIAVLLGGGDDQIIIRPGAVFNGRIDGGTGRDTLVITSTDAVIVDLVAGTLNAWRATGFEVVNTGNQPDVVTLGPSHTAQTFGGDDRIIVLDDSGTEANGGFGNDTIDFSRAAGIAGALDLALAQFTTLNGGKFSGFENIVGSAAGDFMYGSAGDNSFTGNAGNDVIDGRDGTDTAAYDFAKSSSAATVNAAAVSSAGNGAVQDGLGGTDQLSHIERLVFTGSAFADTAIGGGTRDAFTGNAGNDTLNGNGGLDTLSGGDGNDSLLGGGGEDSALGGVGNDTIYGEAGNDTLDGGADADRLYGGDGVDTLAGGIGDDVLDGGAGNDGLAADDGNDTLTGGTGNDGLAGGAGNDALTGGDGNDTLNGGAGNDTLIGGASADRYLFQTANSGADTIFGFNAAEGDRLNLSGGTFTAASESAGNTTLTHTGGTIVIRGVTGLSLAQWNGLTAEPFTPESATFHPHTDYLL